MRNAILVLFVSLLMFHFSACDNTIDINAEYQEETFIYGLLEINEQDQYIRIQKNYLQNGVSALTLAEDPTNTYYPVEDILVELSPAGQEEYTTLTADTLPKDPGTFSSSSNIVYRYSEPLQANVDYTIRVTDLTTGKIVTATTAVVQEFQLQIPPDGTDPILLNLDNKDRFGFNEPLEFLCTQPLGGKVFDIKLRFHYTEFRPNEDPEVKFTDVFIASSYTVQNANSSQAISIKYEGQKIMTAFANKLIEDPLTTRELLTIPCELIILCGGEAYWDYYKVNILSQTGITALEATPLYTNIENGLGLFSSRYIKHRRNLRLDEASKLFLACDPSTKGKNIIIPEVGSCN